MAHQIEDNQFAYAGEPAWHGLGTPIDPQASPKEWLKTANLDYPVEARSLVMRDAHPYNDGKIHFISENLKGYKAIVRADTQKVFGIMSNRYHVVQNLDVVEFFQEFIAAGGAEMETVGALRGGAQVWALAKVKGADAKIGGVDQMKGRLLMMTAFDGTSPTIAKAVDERVVCGNTMAIALGEKGKEIRIRHSRKWTKELADSAKQQLGIAVERIQHMNALAEQFAKVKVDGKSRIKFLQELLNKQPVVTGTNLPVEPTKEELERVLAGVASASGGSVEEDEIKALGKVGADILEATFSSPGSQLSTADGTLWGLVNGVTYYVDHVRGRTQDSRLSHAWFGSGATMKEDAVDIAQELAGITA